MDAYSVEMLDIFIKCVLINGVSMFGIVGNSINIMVLNKHGFREPTNIILVSLSISDLIFCILLPITRLKCIIRHFDVSMAISMHTFVTVFFFMPKFVFLGTSFWLVALIAVERFTAVFFPFHVSRIFRKTVVKFIVTTLVLASVVSISPSFFALNYQLAYNEQFNQTIAMVTYTNFYQRSQSILDFYVWVGLTNIFCSISMTTVLVCCLAIGFKLLRGAVKREQMTSKSTGYDVKVVKMLLTICVIYLCVQVPTIVMYSYFRPNFKFNSPVHQLFNDVCDVLCAINASANFVVYVTMSRKFANTYKMFVCCTASRLSG